MAPAPAPLPPFAQASAGAFGSAVSNSLVYPLDLLSTRLQTAPRRARQREAAAVASGAQRPATLVGALREIHRRNGLRGLYKGWQSDTLSTTLSNFLFFYFRSFLLALALRRKAAAAGASRAATAKAKAPALSAPEDLLIGALAGCLSRAVTTPLSNVTVRAQTSSKTLPRTPAQEDERRLALKEKDKAGSGSGPAAKGAAHARSDSDSSTDEETAYKDDAGDDASPGIVDGLREIVRERGVLGLWSGYDTAVLLSVVPALTFYLTNFYSRVLARAIARTPAGASSSAPPAQGALATFATSALGNASATLLVFPLILAKTRLQWRSPSGRRVYASLADALRKTVRKGGGPAALYQGLHSQLLKGFFSHGVTMLVKQRVEALFVLAFLALRHRKIPEL